MSGDHKEQVDDGWTHVKRGKGKEPVYMHGLNPQSRDMTVAKVRAEFEGKKRRWLNSSCYRQVLQILDRNRPDEGWQIGDAVCLATGSFSRDNWQNRQRTLMQFVAFVTIVEHLQEAQTTKILCYAQEPEYTPVDKEFLDSMGLTTLQHDEASRHSGLGAAGNHLNASTFVFEPFMDVGITSTHELFGDGVRLYIGSSMQRWVNRLSKSETDSKGMSRESREQVQHSLRSRRLYKYPEFEEDSNIFEGMRISWKEPQDDEEG